ncbi:MFS transporter [Oscillospiraceae bacterium MB08-C2-2]|nr:MFS transporter [Oscillospiraceae bacterium MB08-C2-2]
MINWKRKFLFLGVGQAASILTSSIMQMALVWYLTQRTGSAAVITMSTLSGYLPRAILGMFTGAFIDRYDRRKIMVLSDSVIALAAVLLAGVALLTEIPIWLIFLILCIRSVGAAFHSPSLNAIIPSIVPKEELARYAGFLQGFESVSMILSPALAAFLFSIWELSAIVLLDVLGAAVAVAIVLLLRLPKSNASHSTEKVHIWRDTKEGLAVLRREKGMIAILVISSLYAFIYFPIGSLYPLITMTYFGGSVADSSVVEMVFAGGTLAGALLLGWIGKKIHKVAAIAASIGIYGLGATFSGLLSPSSLPFFILISGVMGITIPFFYGLRTAIFQSRIPNEYLGRVLSLVYSVSLFATPVGLLMGGGFSELAGVQNCFLICGILALCLALVMFFTPSIRNSCNDPQEPTA